MTTQELQEKAKLIKPLIDALVEGKTVQVKYHETWIDVPHADALSYDLKHLNHEAYRIKPREPRELWYCEQCRICVPSMHGDILNFSGHKLIHYKEIID